MGSDNTIDLSKKTSHTTLHETSGENDSIKKTNGSSIDISDKTVLSEKRVKEFTPLLEKPDLQVAVSDKHKELIEAFKTLKQHGLTVKRTDTPDKLHSTLEYIAPTTKDNILLNNAFASFAGSYILGIEVGKDTQSGAMTTIYLPTEQILSLSEHLKAYKTTEECRDFHSWKEDYSRTNLQKTADEIKNLKELTNKGAELYLKFHPGASFHVADKSHPCCAKVNPEIFHWFMNNTTYIRKKNASDYLVVPDAVGLCGFYGQIAANVLLGRPNPMTTTVTQTVVSDGFMDAKADGEPNEPAIHGYNWKEFSANLNKLSSQIDKEAQEKKTAEKEFNLLTGKTLINGNTVTGLGKTDLLRLLYGNYLFNTMTFPTKQHQTTQNQLLETQLKNIEHNKGMEKIIRTTMGKLRYMEQDIRQEEFKTKQNLKKAQKELVTDLAIKIGNGKISQEEGSLALSVIEKLFQQNPSLAKDIIEETGSKDGQITYEAFEKYLEKIGWGKPS